MKDTCCACGVQSHHNNHASILSSVSRWPTKTTKPILTMRTIFSFAPLCVLTVIELAHLALAADSSLTLELPALPYAYTELEPHLSHTTLEIHHNKHHAKYVATTNSMIQGTKYEGKSLEEIMHRSYKAQEEDLYNNAAQSWNHAFYWNCMTPYGGGKPPAKFEQLNRLLRKSFGSYEVFREEFAHAGNSAFGSGWAWLVLDKKSGKLFVTKTVGADNPMVLHERWYPILGMDVWEHAYYLDYQNLRPAYVDTFMDKLVNWDFVAKSLDEGLTAKETTFKESDDEL